MKKKSMRFLIELNQYLGGDTVVSENIPEPSLGIKMKSTRYWAVAMLMKSPAV